MTDETLYIYYREDGGLDVSPEKPVGVEYTTSHRLIADEGYMLTDGEITTPCVDTYEPEKWEEIEAPEEEEI